MSNINRVSIVEAVADAHYIVGFGMETRCICGEWSYYPDESSFDLHRAQMIVAALDGMPKDMQPGRWWRVLDTDGTLWCETSYEAETRGEVRPGRTLQRLWLPIPGDNEWRNTE